MNEFLMSGNIIFKSEDTKEKFLFYNLIFKNLKPYQIQHILAQSIKYLAFFFCKEFNYQFFFKRWQKGIM